MIASLLHAGPASAQTPPPAAQSAPSTDGWIVYQSNQDGQHDVWIARGDGTDPQKLTPASLDRDDGQPSLAKDATRVVFASCRDTDPEDSLFPCQLGDVNKIVANANIFSMNPDGSKQTRLTGNGALGRIVGHDGSPTLSPDGSTIGFVSIGDGDAEILTMSAEGGAPVNRTNNAFIDDFDPAWSPDGTQIVFASDRPAPGELTTGDADVYVINTDGTGAPRRLTVSAGDDTSPAWSPDGKQIAFVSDRAGNNDIYVMDAPTPTSLPEAGLTRLTVHDGDDRDPAWSPSGLELAFATNRADEGAAGISDFEIYLMNASGSGLQQVTDNAAVDVAPSWAENVRSSVSPSKTAASPASIPVSRIPFQPASPQTQADLAGGAISLFGIELANGIPLDLIGLGPNIPLDQIDLGSGVPIDLIILSPGVPLEEIGLSTGIGILEIILGPGIPGEHIGLGWFEALGGLPLSSIPLTPPHAWKDILPGTGLDGPLHTIAFKDVLLANDTQPPTIADVDAGHIDLSGPPFGSVSLTTFLLGAHPLKKIVPPFGTSPQDWCGRLEALGYANCGAEVGGLDASLLQLELAGVPFDDDDHPIRIFDITIGDLLDLDAADLPIEFLVGGALKYGVTSLGDVKVSQVPVQSVPEGGETTTGRRAFFDCTIVDCTDASDTTIVQAQRTIGSDGSSGILRRAVVGHLLGETSGTLSGLRLGEVILALFGDFPVESIPYERLNVRGWREAQSTAFEYEFEYAPVRVDRAVFPVIDLRFPPRFLFDSATLEVPGIAERGAIQPTGIRDEADAVHLTFEPELSVPSGSKLRLRVTMRPGDRLQIGDTDVDIAAPIPELREKVATVEVTDTFEATPVAPGNGESAATTVRNDDCTSAELPSLQPDLMYTSFTTRFDIDCFVFEAPPRGSLVSVTMGTQDIDRDMVAYTTGSVDAPLRAVSGDPASMPLVGAEDLGFTFANRPVQPDGVSTPLVPALKVAAFTQVRGTHTEQVSFVSAGEGDYRIQVSGYNGASSDSPYTLRLKVRPPRTLTGAVPPPFEDVDVPTPVPMSAAPRIAPTTETLILWNEGRWRMTNGVSEANDLKASLADLAAMPGVKGAVLDVGSVAEIDAAFDLWDVTPGDPEASNTIVRRINDYVDSLFNDPDHTLPVPNGPAEETLRYIVLVGDHVQMPFAATRDLTTWGNEEWYDDPARLTGANSYSAPYLLGYVLTDDPYAAALPRPVPGGWLYEPTWPTGRLVETTDEIITAIDNFAASGGKVAIRRGASIGADFMKDLAKTTDGSFEQRLGAPQPDLIGDAITKSQLNSLVFGTSRPDAVSVQLHSDGHSSLLPGSPNTPFTAADIDAQTQDIADGWFTMGCHSGDPRPDIMGPPGQAAMRNWSQALADQAAFSVSQTTFGLGSKPLVLSEEVVADTVANTYVGPASVGAPLTIGYALASAKRAYLSRNGIPGVYDKKALEAATVYGLPMYGLSGAQVTPFVDEPAPAGPAVAGATTSSGPGPAPDPVTGLPSQVIEVTPDLQLVVSDDGTYFRDRRGGIQFTHGRPITPKRAVDVSVDGFTARGVTIEARSSMLQASVRQAIARPELSGPGTVVPPAPRIGDMSFPNTPATITQSDDGQNLVAMLAHFAATNLDGNAVIGRRLVDDALTYRVYYSTATSSSAPAFHETAVERRQTPGGHEAVFTAKVTDDEGVAGVSAMYLDNDLAWHLVQLAPDPDDEDTWTATTPFAGPGIEAFFQAVDATGLTSFELAKGFHHAGLDIEPAEPYTFVGPFPPGNKKAQNAGRTIPVKFALFQGGESVARLDAIRAFEWYENTTGLAEPKPAAGTLKLEGKVYHFNWKTDAAWAGKQIVLLVHYDDGTMHRVLYRFKDKTPKHDDDDDDDD